MAYVPVPKDLSKVKTKVAFNLTKRQILCFLVALLMGLPLFFLLKGSAGTNLAAMAMIVVMLPCFLLAMYFSHMVLDDLNLIIRDIRETHKKDSESAPQTTVADELKENLEAVENFKGSRLEKLAVLYCKQLGINYKNLSEEEFRWLIRILQKSKKMGTPISQRKKR